MESLWYSMYYTFDAVDSSVISVTEAHKDFWGYAVDVHENVCARIDVKSIVKEALHKGGGKQ